MASSNSANSFKGQLKFTSLDSVIFHLLLNQFFTFKKLAATRPTAAQRLIHKPASVPVTTETTVLIEKLVSTLRAHAIRLLSGEWP